MSLIEHREGIEAGRLGMFVDGAYLPMVRIGPGISMCRSRPL